MAGIDLCFRGKDEQFGSDIADESVVVSRQRIVEVGASDSASEEGVAGEEDFVGWGAEADAAGRVAGCMDDAKCYICEDHIIAVHQENVGGRGGDIFADHGCEVFRGR